MANIIASIIASKTYNWGDPEQLQVQWHALRSMNDEPSDVLEKGSTKKNGNLDLFMPEKEY